MAVTAGRRSPATLLPDEVIRQLVAAGQADIVVGVPTLDNAATVGQVVAAAEQAAAAAVGFRRVLVFNSDGGSTDGTTDQVLRATAGAPVMASHSLRTIHRIVAPYHGLPGKPAALRTIVAVAELLQARAVLVVDANATEASPAVFASLLAPVLDASADVAVLAPDRDPREGPLVTQVVRPLLAGACGATFEDPLGGDIAMSLQTLPGLLGQPAWNDDALRPGIDLWLRAFVLASGAPAIQIATRPRTPPAGSRVPLRDVVQQVLRATWRCLELVGRPAGAAPMGAPVTRRVSSGDTAEPEWALDDLARVFRDAARDLAPLWRSVLPPEIVEALAGAAAAPVVRVDDDVWAAVLVHAARASCTHARPDDLAMQVVPIYLGRVAGFMHDARGLPPGEVRRRIDALERAVGLRLRGTAGSGGEP